MFTKVFLVCAFALCLAQAHKDNSGEEHDKTNKVFAFQKSIVKDYRNDEKYEKREHDYPYYNQYFYQQPYLNHKYYNHQIPYVRGEEYLPYQHWQKHDFEGKFYPMHHGYQYRQGEDVENRYDHYRSFYPYHQGYYYPHNVGGYKCQGVECLTHHYQNYQQGYVHPLLNRFYGHGYHHYPLYEV